MSKQSFKIKSLQEAEDWFKTNPGRSVTCEHGDDSVNITSIEQARSFFQGKPKAEKAKKPDE